VWGYGQIAGVPFARTAKRPLAAGSLCADKSRYARQPEPYNRGYMKLRSDPAVSRQSIVMLMELFFHVAVWGDCCGARWPRENPHLPVLVAITAGDAHGP
jgi:hypothetical protein